MDGEREIDRAVDLATMPLFVRSGAIIPMGPVKQYTNERSLVRSRCCFRRKAYRGSILMIHTTSLLRFVLSAAVLLVGAVPRSQDDKIQQKPFVEDYVRPVMSAPPASLGVDPFYKKHADSLDIAILSSEKVPDAALLVARGIVIHKLAQRPDLRAEMLKKKMRVGDGTIRIDYRYP